MKPLTLTVMRASTNKDPQDPTSHMRGEIVEGLPSHIGDAYIILDNLLEHERVWSTLGYFVTFDAKLGDKDKNQFVILFTECTVLPPINARELMESDYICEVFRDIIMRPSPLQLHDVPLIPGPRTIFTGGKLEMHFERQESGPWSAQARIETQSLHGGYSSIPKEAYTALAQELKCPLQLAHIHTFYPTDS